MGDAESDPVRLSFNPQLRVEFRPRSPVSGSPFLCVPFLMMMILVSGCFPGLFIPSIPATPTVEIDLRRLPEPIPGSLAVVIERSFMETQSAKPAYTQRGVRVPAHDIKVNIGRSSREVLELVLPRLFERVVFVESKGVAGYDFILHPTISSHSIHTGAKCIESSVTTCLNASISYDFEFVGGGERAIIEVLRVSGSGHVQPPTGSYLGAGLAGVVAPMAFGTAEAGWAASAFALAQQDAVSQFISALPQSKVAEEARRLRRP